MGASKGCNSMDISGLSFGNTLVGIGWAISVLIYIYKLTEKTVLSPCWTSIPESEAFFPVSMSGCPPRAMTIASLLMGGCGLSHECVEDGT